MNIAAEHAKETEALATVPPRPEDPLPDAATWQASLTAAELLQLLSVSREGYWHFEMSHNMVLEREYQCTLCHSARVPFYPLNNRESDLAQTQVCTNCH